MKIFKNLKISPLSGYVFFIWLGGVLFVLQILGEPYLPYHNTWTQHLFSYGAFWVVTVMVTFVYWVILKLITRIFHNIWLVSIVLAILSYPLIVWMIVNNASIKYNTIKFSWPLIYYLLTHGIGYYNMHGMAAFLVYMLLVIIFLAVYGSYLIVFFIAHFTRITAVMKKIFEVSIVLGVVLWVVLNIVIIRSVYENKLMYLANGSFITGFPAITASSSLHNSGFIRTILFVRKNNHYIPLDTYKLNNHLQYPLHPLQYKKIQNRPNVLFIVVDTLAYRFYDHAMPYTKRWARNNIEYTHNISVGTYTLLGTFGMFYSISGNYINHNFAKNPVYPVIWEVLKQYRYPTPKLFFLTDPLALTLQYTFKGFKNNDYSTLKNWQQDAKATKSIIHIIKNTKQKPFFIVAYLSAVHQTVYPKKGKYKGFIPLYEPCHPNMLTANYTLRTQLYNCVYDGAEFDDLLIYKMIQALKKTGIYDNTIVVITADHGQEIFDKDHQIFGHGTLFNRYQTHIPLIIHWPGKKPKRVHYFTSNYDIIPTLLKNAFGVTNPISDYSMGRDLFALHNNWDFLPVALRNKYGEIKGDTVYVFDSYYMYWDVYAWSTGLPIKNAKPLNANELTALIQRLTHFSK